MKKSATKGITRVSVCRRAHSILVEFGMDLGAAFHQPRIDVSGGGGVVDNAGLPSDVQTALEAVAPVTRAPRTVHPCAFAVPAGVARHQDLNSGCTEITTPWGDAVHEDEV